MTCLHELLLHRPTTGKASVESSSLEPANCTELPMASDGCPHGCSLCTSLYHIFGNITKSLKTNNRKAERRRAGGGRCYVCSVSAGLGEVRAGCSPGALGMEGDNDRSGQGAQPISMHTRDVRRTLNLNLRSNSVPRPELRVLRQAKRGLLSQASHSQGLPPWTQMPLKI